jgi:hypothetical protein
MGPEEQSDEKTETKNGLKISFILSELEYFGMLEPLHIYFISKQFYVLLHIYHT